MTLKKQGKIAELWVCEIDMIGRDAPMLIMFFFDFCEDGGRIRTPYFQGSPLEQLSARKPLASL
jgi:hypothetical protein